MGASLQPGDRIGRHRLVAQIGKGAVGSAWLAEHVLLGRKAVILVLTSQDERERQGVIQGARLQAELSHPNIAPLHEIEEHEGMPCLVTGHVDGQDLGRLLRSSGPLDVAVGLRLMASLAAALDHAHERGVIHRDIKPANIILARSGEPVLIDFAVASPHGRDPLLPDGMVIGTPDYMSPEQIRGEPPLPAHDLWALAATFHRLVAGRGIVPSTTIEETLEAIGGPEPIDLQPLARVAPPAVVEFFAECLDKDPARRFRTAAALRQGALAALSHVEQLPADPDATRPRPRPPAEGDVLLLRVEHREPERPGEFRRFSLGPCLGEGGYGSVFRATDDVTESAVALKFLRLDAASDDLRARFRRETALLAQVRHPHVVRLINFGERAGSPFLVMELVPGGTLQQRLQQRGPLPPDEATGIGADVLAGLAALHDFRAVHRDVKPANIGFIDGRAVLLDFGLAMIEDASRITRSGLAVGSFSYMSPEQARGERVTSASDVYAAGVVLYEALTLRRPHEADEALDVLRLVGSATGVPLQEREPSLPAALVALVGSLLDPVPTLRPSAATAAAALREMACATR